MKRILLTLAALGTALTMQAKVVLPGIFGDNMVLQQQSEAQFWGKAAPGKKVTIRPSWSTQGITANVGKDGRWRAAVPTPEAGGPYTIELSDGERLTLRDVLIGEVWLCSGQSNMVAGTSATAYYFARYLQSVLDVPVGVIVTCWGGTPVEAWMDRETMSGFKEFDLSFLDNPDQIDRPQYKPCGLYNGMIAPLVPYTVKGFLWYQGESNRPNPTQYRALMPAFVKMLRERWAQGELPFYYVQIAPYRYDGPNAISGALLREAQLHNLKDIPSSGMAVTLDIGDEGCIHPAKKEEVGTRLAWLALSKTYGMKGIDADTPVCEKMEVADGKAYLTFATGPDGLAPYGRTLTGFEMAGADRVFHPATARIEKGKSRLIVACDAVPEPVAVRYAFRNVPEATLFNTSGIPASSFRTDDWEVK